MNDEQPNEPFIKRYRRVRGKTNYEPSVVKSTSGNWEKIFLPNIKNVFPELIPHDFLTIQPMSLPSSLVFYMEIMDSKNPVIGQIFHVEDKHKHKKSCSCLRGPSWNKIWTPKGWVMEKGNKKAYQKAVDKYNVKYRADEKARHEEECKNAIPQKPMTTDDMYGWLDQKD